MSIVHNPSFELADNLDIVAGATLTWSLSSFPATPGSLYEQKRESLNLDSRFRCCPLTAEYLFARECRAVTQNYRTDAGTTRKLTNTPPHKDDEQWVFSFVVGRKGSRSDAGTGHIGRITLDLQPGTVTWCYDWCPRKSGETREDYIQRAQSTRPAQFCRVDVLRFAGAAEHVQNKVSQFVGCVDVDRYRDTMYSVLQRTPAFKISQGTWFIPNDVSAGDDNPLRTALDLQKMMQAVNAENRIFLTPVFPSRDAIAAACNGAEQSLDARIAELEDKLDDVAFSRSDTASKWQARWDEVESQAKLYERLLGMQMSRFQTKIEAARTTVERKAQELVDKRAEKAAAKDDAAAAKAAALTAKIEAAEAAAQAAAAAAADNGAESASNDVEADTAPSVPTEVERVEMPKVTMRSCASFAHAVVGAGTLEVETSAAAGVGTFDDEGFRFVVTDGPNKGTEVQASSRTAFARALRQALAA